ncbi:hypothetical protein [uncultured Bacteroides sp.]|uniref:hypothetical protein n=1 Tax=uncultured Bacteroides sp. TaxID=162156 RepID=UPI002AAB11EB|nr:hypothetical protein [uncultured Bacteroides sp.]
MDISLIITIVVIVIWIQIAFFFKTVVGIRTLKNLYPSVSTLSIIKENGTQVISVNSKKVLLDFTSIIDSTNSYLRENQGTDDFYVIQNLSERVSTSKESEAASGISIPLYVGLMGTFVGVAVGLFSLNVIGIYSEQGINYFLWGVVIAMVTSFVGLLLSTIANYKLAYAIKCRDHKKNKYYTFVQTKLLPGMGSNIVDALGRLKGTLDNFNTVFSDNIGNINNIVVNLAENMQTIADGIGTQKEILNELYSSKYQNLIKVNMDIIDRTEKMLPAMDDFVQKQKNLNEVMEKNSQFIASMHKLLDRVSTFESSINELGESINESQLLGSKQLNLVQRHLTDLDQKQSLVENYTNQSNDVVEEYLKVNLKSVRSLVDNFETAIKNAFEITNQESPFQKLANLEVISEEIKQLNETLFLYTQKEEEFMDIVSTIRNDVKSLKSDGTNIEDSYEGDAEE